MNESLAGVIQVILQFYSFWPISVFDGTFAVNCLMINASPYENLTEAIRDAVQFKPISNFCRRFAVTAE